MNGAHGGHGRHPREGTASGPDPAFLESLQGALYQGGEGGPTIAALDRTSLAHESSYDIELITLHLAEGPALRILLKDFGNYKRVKEDCLGAGNMADRGWREVRVYRDILSPGALGTPRYHGFVQDESQQRFWLLLEYVEARGLSSLDFEHWLEAARWLGRMQGHFSALDLREVPFLVEHSSALFTSVAEEALRATHAASPRLGGRLRSALSGYGDLVALMAADRSTLVHGAYFPSNILVRPDGSCRVCVVDWEETARGSALYDLGFLADGFERKPSRLDAMIDGYREAAAAAGLAVDDRGDLHRLVQAFLVHRRLKTLTKAKSRQLPVAGVSRLVERVEELVRRI